MAPPALKAKEPPRPPKQHTPFDIDIYLNPFVPRSCLSLLPRWLSFFLGYRPSRPTPPGPTPHHPLKTFIVWASIFIGAFCGLAIIENVFLALPRLTGHQVPIIIASYGAAAILEYNTIESPLSQPRNLFLGHFFSAVVAVGITKLFLHLPADRFEELRWLAGALAVAAASVIMSITKTVHPPAGATALLAATNVEIQELGWWLLPLTLLASTLMLASACVINNASGRRFPLYWWTPVDVAKLREERRGQTRPVTEVDIEKVMSGSTTVAAEPTLSETDTEAGSQSQRGSQYANSERPPLTVDEVVAVVNENQGQETIVLGREKIFVPGWLEVNDWERQVLEILRERLRDGLVSQ